ncbi:MAG: four helix bundle protein [Polyangia bacterium]
MSPKFAFQRLEVYGVAKAIAQLTIENRRRWADLPGELAERLSRATLAMVAEIASGAAQSSRAEQRRHYQSARGSANEAMSCVEVAQLHGAVPEELREALASQLARIDAMLTGMVRRRSS